MISLRVQGSFPGSFFNAVHRGTLPLAIVGIPNTFFTKVGIVSLQIGLPSRSEVAMPGDDADMEVEDTATSVDVQGTGLQVPQQLAVIETEVPTRKTTGRRRRLHHVPSKSHQAKRAARHPAQP